MMREHILLTLRQIFAFFIFFLSISSAIDILTPSHPLSNGEILISTNGAFALGFFTPPNTTNSYLGIWYHNLAVQTVVWVANRRNPIPNLNATLSITADNAALHLKTSGNSKSLWSSPSFPNSIPSPIAQLLDTGNLVIKAPNSTSYLWQSFDYPTDTLLSGMKLGLELKTGIDRNLTAWMSNSDPSQGKYALAIDTIGVPQMVIRDASGSWLWRCGPWNGYIFSGSSTLSGSSLNQPYYRDFLYSFKSTPEEMYYEFKTSGDSIFRLTLDRKGQTDMYERKASSQEWDLDWYAPNDACDFYSACGANAVCDASSSPMCRCLEGFDPRNPASWRRGNWSDGCARVETLGCEAGVTDEFAVVRSSKLPDTREAVADMSLGFDECRARCLMNCSCQAYATGDLRGGYGCIFWMAEIKDLRVFTYGGEDLYVRAASVTKGRRKRKTWVFVVTSIAPILFLLAIFILIFLLRRQKYRNEDHSISSINWGHEIMHKHNASKEGNSKVSLFQFAQIVSATNNFSDINKLGEGGFGPVYKGKLLEGQNVAIKRLSTISTQGVEEFKNEILLIARLQHRNLVRLLGYCIFREEKMLIYEFMPNKSLDLLLFNVERGLQLEWTRRFQIIEGIAQGLLYLHKHSRLTVIHRDLKASNILLDADMNPKISDFGMARIFDAHEGQAITRRIVGTYGYMSPEYALNGLFSIKSDAYSFGVLLLEIVSGKRNVGFRESDSWCNLLAYAWNLWREGTWLELVDPALDNNFRHDEVARCIYVALLCIQESPDDRPIMTDVLSMLSNESLLFNSVKQPTFFFMKNDSKSKFSLNRYVNASNGLSISTIAGR